MNVTEEKVCHEWSAGGPWESERHLSPGPSPHNTTHKCAYNVQTSPNVLAGLGPFYLTISTCALKVYVGVHVNDEEKWLSGLSS